MNRWGPLIATAAALALLWTGAALAVEKTCGAAEELERQLRAEGFDAIFEGFTVYAGAPVLQRIWIGPEGAWIGQLVFPDRSACLGRIQGGGRVLERGVEG